MPANIGWERALLGTALADPDTMAAAEIVLPSDMTGCHQVLWSEMVSLQSRGALGPRALVEALRSANVLNTIGMEDDHETGERYIANLIRYRGEEMPEYANQVVNASIKRQLTQTAALIRSEAEDRDIPADEALDNAERRVMGLRRDRKDGVSMADLMAAVSGRMQTGPTGNIWTPGIPELKETMGFAEPEDFIIYASRPGEGKSSHLRFEGGVYAIQKAKPVLLINMENSDIEIARSFISMVSGIDKSKIKSGNLTDEERDRVNTAIDVLTVAPLYVKTMASPSARQVERACRQYIHEHNVELILVDYIQLMRNPGEDNRVQDLSLSSGILRGVALQNKVPLLAACQMSRAIEQRGEDPEPQLSDLRESGSLEQDSTIVIFPRNVWRNPQEAQLRLFRENIDGNRILNKAVPVRLHIKKNRNGPVGTTKPFLFDKATNLFRSIPGEMFE